MRTLVRIFSAFLFAFYLSLITMKRAEKPFVIEDLKKRFEDAKSVVALDYQGLTVKDSEKLRRQITEAGGKLVVAKNTLLKLALKNAKVAKVAKVEEVEKGLQGPTAVVFAEEDEVAPLQRLGKFIAEKGLPRLKFGIFGTEIFDAEKLLALSKLPGRNVLLGRLVGTIAGPSYALVGTLNANMQKLVYVLNAKIKN